MSWILLRMNVKTAGSADPAAVAGGSVGTVEGAQDSTSTHVLLGSHFPGPTP
jgi:hypothetical protein